MDLVAETADEYRYDASDEQEREQRRRRKSKDAESVVDEDNNDVSCFLDILKGDS